MANWISNSHLRHHKTPSFPPWQFPSRNGGHVRKQFAQFPLLLLLPRDPRISGSDAFHRCFLPRFRPSPSLLRRGLHPVLLPMRSVNSQSSIGEEDNQNPASSPPTTVRVVIKGRVQGVFYRNWTVDNATNLGLKGWVRNRRDGSVEALFSGSSDKVREMEQRCRSGPPDAIVTGFQVLPSSEDPGIGFDRRPTA